MDQLNINQIPLKEGTIEFFDIIEICPFKEIYELCLIHKQNAYNLNYCCLVKLKRA